MQPAMTSLVEFRLATVGASTLTFAEEMKTITIIALFAVVATAYADEEVAAKATSGRFEVTQEYQGDFIETVRFSNPKLSAVRLSGLSWPGIYSISPNEQWMLRTQKTGSGESIAILYRIEENDRVSEVVGFDDLLWGVSDTTSRLKKKELYHTCVSKVAWSEDNATLEIVLRGSNASKSGDGIECRTFYDLKDNRAVVKATNSEQDGGGQPATRPESK
jgi:hypothetical protein